MKVATDSTGITAPAKGASFRFGSALKSLAGRKEEVDLRSRLFSLFALCDGATVRLRALGEAELTTALEALSSRRPNGENENEERRAQVEETLSAVLLELRALGLVVPHRTLEALEHAGFRVPARVWSGTLDALRRTVCQGVRALFATTHGQVTHVRRPTEQEIASTMAELLHRCTPSGLHVDRGALFGEAIEMTLVELARGGVVVEEGVLDVLEASLR